jgi:hypothetical protein
LHGALVSELEGDCVGDAAHWAASLLRSAQQHGTALVALRAAADLGKVEADADARAVMAAELAHGNVLLALAKPFEIAGAPCTAWWRVEPGGAVLAVGSDGRGQGSMEGMTVLKDISIPMVRRCMTFVACLNRAVAGGASMQSAGASCLSGAIRDIVKQSLDQSIKSFAKDPWWQKGLSGAPVGGSSSDYKKLYAQAKTAWKRYRDVEKSGAAAGKAGADIGSALGGRIYLLLAMGRDIAEYGSKQ